MDRDAIMIRIAALVVAIGLALIVLALWGQAAGIMGRYFAVTTAPASAPAPAKDGVVSVDVLPPPKAPPKTPPAQTPPSNPQ